MTDREWISDSLRAASEVFAETAASCRDEIAAASRAAAECIKAGGKLMLCGNGGSAADAQHIAAEMTVKMKRVRSPLPAFALTTNTSLLTAQANDLGFDTVFSRQIESLGREGDVLIAISTSGNSPNILRGAETARDMGIKVVGLTGRDGGKLAPMSDIAISVPSDDVPRIQEAHIAIGHLICEFAENTFFPDSPGV
ncbi:MAG: D-sedoheptulose 7-phosphate isomerase [Candidatus Eisenbacteria bacterium]